MINEFKVKHENNIKELLGEFERNNILDREYYSKIAVKRGLRNEDGTGVVAGLTQICNVHGFVMDEGEKKAIDGELIYRGYQIQDLVNGAIKEDRFGYEEVIWLLLFGELPTKIQRENFTHILAASRSIPDDFVVDMIMKTPSPDIMNKMARCVLALYSYDDRADDTTPLNLLLQSVGLIAKAPTIMVNAYQIKRRYYEGKSMFFHRNNIKYSIAEYILSQIRPDQKFTKDEARLLDICLMLHAEHGGGNNSTFTCRALTSSGTDTYAAISAAIGSLKGPLHGGANSKVTSMIENMKANIKNWDNEEEVADYLRLILDKKANDMSGLIYGTGHAVYTKSDPRALILRDQARKLAYGTEYEKEFKLLELVEKLAPIIFEEKRGNIKSICANVDLYSGFVYKMLGIPQDLFTPLFAVSRMAGWCAHRIEESINSKRIMRPAYKAVLKKRPYISTDERGKCI